MSPILIAFEVLVGAGIIYMVVRIVKKKREGKSGED